MKFKREYEVEFVRLTHPGLSAYDAVGHPLEPSGGGVKRLVIRVVARSRVEAGEVAIDWFYEHRGDQSRSECERLTGMHEIREVGLVLPWRKIGFRSSGF